MATRPAAADRALTPAALRCVTRIADEGEEGGDPHGEQRRRSPEGREPPDLAQQAAQQRSDRQPDPDNRRRLALRLTEAGRLRLTAPPAADGSLEGRIAKLAHSELRALERGLEILERLPR